MIGRATIGNPWIFSKIMHYLQTGKILPDVPLQERLNIIKEHFNLELEEKGEYTGIREFRKHLAYYTKGLPESSEFRSKINKIENKEDLIKMIDNYFQSI